MGHKEQPEQQEGACKRLIKVGCKSSQNNRKVHINTWLKWAVKARATDGHIYRLDKREEAGRLGEKQGWIKLHRTIRECFLWDDKPYDRARAWIDMLLSAMHSDKKTILDGKIAVISKGSFVTSIEALPGRWGWSRNKVRSFLEMLESEQMIRTRRTGRGTTVTIVNYEKYQLNGTAGSTAESTTGGTAGSTTESTAESTQKKNLKNSKNDKNINNKNIVHTDAAAEELFGKLWPLYPVKKGRGQVSLSAKKRLLEVGFDEMSRAMDRYKAELEKDSSWRKPQNGSTFFNSGYIDYLDANYVPDEKTAVKKKGTNQFNNICEHGYDAASLDSLERKLLSKH